MRPAVIAAIVALAALAAVHAHASPVVVAVIAGVNTGVDPELPPLRYADDDAVLYAELFRELGATTLLLARFDDNTLRLHPQAAAEARPPRRAELDRAVREAAAAITAARARGAPTAFYFVYAGHGNVRDGQGYIGLEDDRLTAADLERRIVDAVAADQTHVVIDACYSGLLAGARGPGGERRPLRGFSRFQGLADDDRIGLVLSTSSARESHEWEGFQSGVFSYEVRSGMYGAADADGDGTVSYQEIAAFVARANAAIPNERFRPDVYARPPRAGGTLLDLRDALRRRLEVGGGSAGHYVLEDGLGVRLLDFHNAADQKVTLVRPASRGDLFLERLDDHLEYRITAGSADVVTVDHLEAEAPHVAGRGSAHESFSLTFLLQFDQDVVRRFGTPWPDAVEPRSPPPRRWQRPAGWTALGIGGVGVAAAAGLVLSARSLHDSVTTGASQASVVARNAKISSRNTAAAICVGVGAAALATGATLLLWPEASSGGVHGAVYPAAGGATLELGVTF